MFIVNKIIINIVLIVTTSLCLIGCNSTNKKIEESIMKAEILDKKFANFQISYDDYMNEIKNIYNSKYYTEDEHIKRTHPIIDINKENYIKAQKQATKDAIRYDAEIQISKVYNDKNNMKIVFTKVKIIPRNKNLPIQHLTKKYYFSKENNEWKIIGKDAMCYYEKFDKPIMYTTFDGKPIEYIQKVNLFP